MPQGAKETEAEREIISRAPHEGEGEKCCFVSNDRFAPRSQSSFLD
jgi:hypothetical protein